MGLVVALDHHKGATVDVANTARALVAVAVPAVRNLAHVGCKQEVASTSEASSSGFVHRGRGSCCSLRSCFILLHWRSLAALLFVTCCVP